jgi:hypothetical protein
LPPDVTARLAEQFPDDRGASACALLLGIPHLTPRVARCVVFLAGGDLLKFADFAQAAIEDPRDVMFWAEYENHDDPSPRWVRDFMQPFDAD